MAVSHNAGGLLHIALSAGREVKGGSASTIILNDVCLLLLLEKTSGNPPQGISGTRLNHIVQQGPVIYSQQL